MTGVDDNVAVIGDWVPPTPSPRTLFSLLGDDVCSRSMSEPPGNSRKEDRFSGSEELVQTTKCDLNNMALGPLSGDHMTGPSSISDQRPVSRGGLMDRRSGFNAPRLNTENIRSSDISHNSDIQSPYLTIPPGLSPTSLLESPVFVSNFQAQQSPITGKFAFVSNKDSDFVDMDASFAFKPAAESGSSFLFGVPSKRAPHTLPQQSLPQYDDSAQPEKSHQSRNTNTIQTQDRKGFHLQANFSNLSTKKDDKVNTSDIVGSSGGLSPPFEEQHYEERDPRGCGDSVVNGTGGTQSEDGYNWRKYGQKQVKGSEYPRSYYKCTHPNCQVKKKVERSHEGDITEIIYKGAHNHPKPPSNHRLAMGSFSPLTEMKFDNSDQTGAPSGPDGEPGWASAKKGAVGGTVDWKHENHEVTSSASVGLEYCKQSPPLQAPNSGQVGSVDALDVSSTFSNEEEDDRGTHGSVSIGNDGEGDESESKRRKLESYATDMSGATRAIREPRVVVQTTSEVDILDDGYRWRKYGQKVVKGNPNPRSYYKCTNAGCTVRKHVERASHDLKSVITTYEGKHNHEVPAARSSSHLNIGASNVGPAQSAAAAIQAHVLRPDASQVHNSVGRYEDPALGSFNLAGRQQMGPSHSYFGTNQNGLANMGMVTFASTRPKLPVMPVHPYMWQPLPANEMSLVLPKGEPNSENIPGPVLNLSTGSPKYQQMMSRLPLGPQIPRSSRTDFSDELYGSDDLEGFISFLHVN